ncbi:MAG: calcium-binding protein [Hellea sp.]
MRRVYDYNFDRLELSFEVVVFDLNLSASATALTFTDLLSAPPADIPLFADIDGTAGDDTLDGTADADTINGFAGNDVINGLGGDDVLNGGEGEDIIDGGNGDDIITPGGSGAQITGGAGTDFFIIDDLETVFFITIWDLDLEEVIELRTVSAASQSPTFIGTADFTGVANEVRYISSNGEITVQTDIDGDMAPDNFMNLYFDHGGSGELEAHYTPDGYLQLNLPSNIINGTLGDDDPLNGTPNDDVINGLAGDDVIFGFEGEDTISGGAGNDIIEGGLGNDNIDAGSGDDFIIINERDIDVVDGGTGFDIVRMFTVDTELSLVFFDIVTDSGLPEIDVFSYLSGASTNTLLNVERFEQIDQSSGAVQILALMTGPGNDIIDLNAESVVGQALVFGGDGNDIITAGSAYDGTVTPPLATDVFYANYLYGGNGDDVLTGNVYRDILRGDAGADIIDGGDGIDVADYYESDAGIIINLLTGLASGGHAEGDMLSNIEIYNGSNLFADTLIGNAGNDTFRGYGNNDTLSGGAGADVLDGGTGTNTLTGGDGDDVFVSSVFFGSNYDNIVTDFSANDVVAAGGNFIGTAAFSETGSSEVRYEFINGQTVIQIDAIGFGSIIQTITLTNGEFELFSSSLGLMQVIDYSGTLGADAYQGTQANETITGLDGNDVLSGNEGDDIIYGGADHDQLSGGSGADTLWGGIGNDNISGGAGDDMIHGESGDDTLDGGDGVDYAFYDGNQASYTIIDNGDQTWTITGEFTGVDHLTNIEFLRFSDGDVSLAANPSINGTAGNDALTGTIDADVINGLAGNDILNGLAGDDEINGGNGADRLIGGLGADVLNGGAGFDSADYRGAASAVRFNVDTGGTLGEAAGDTFSGIERYYLSDFSDVITGSDANEFFFGEDGNDQINGGGGIDRIYGGDGNDIQRGQDGNDTLYGSAGNDQLNGGAGFDIANYTLAAAGIIVNMLTSGTGGDAAGDTYFGIEAVYGSDFDDSIFGNNSANELRGGDGNDNLEGGGGNDRLFGGAGEDMLFGGTGIDIAVYTDASSGVGVNLEGAGTFGDALNDIYSEIEWVFGSDFNDDITGDSANNRLEGRDGDDTLNGGGGNDRLLGGNGNDTINGGDGVDTIFGQAGDDFMTGGAGNDFFFGGQGNDDHDGGAGIDTVSYLGSSAGLTINMIGTGSTGHAEGDSFFSIERVFGSAFDDIIIADADSMILFGNGGNDYLQGDMGNDSLNGGAGIDSFGYDTTFGGADVIQGFSTNELIYITNASFVSDFDTWAEVQAVGTDIGGNVIFDFGFGATLTIVGKNLADLDASNFDFSGMPPAGEPLADPDAFAADVVDVFDMDALI